MSPFRTLFISLLLLVAACSAGAGAASADEAEDLRQLLALQQGELAAMSQLIQELGTKIAAIPTITGSAAPAGTRACDAVCRAKGPDSLCLRAAGKSLPPTGPKFEPIDCTDTAVRDGRYCVCSTPQ